jgi:hypothetical protein
VQRHHRNVLQELNQVLRLNVLLDVRHRHSDQLEASLKKALLAVQSLTALVLEDLLPDQMVEVLDEDKRNEFTNYKTSALPQAFSFV